MTALDRVFGVRMGVWKAKEAASENSETASNLLLSVGLTVLCSTTYLSHVPRPAYRFKG